MELPSASDFDAGQSTGAITSETWTSAPYDSTHAFLLETGFGATVTSTPVTETHKFTCIYPLPHPG